MRGTAGTGDRQWGRSRDFPPNKTKQNTMPLYQVYLSAFKTAKWPETSNIVIIKYTPLPPPLFVIPIGYAPPPTAPKFYIETLSDAVVTTK